MNPAYVVFDGLVCVLAVRSLVVLGSGSRWTSAAWGATFIAAGAAAIRYAAVGPPAVPMLVAEIFFGILTVAFIIGAVRDEPQAEPLMWPRRVGLTRAQRRT
jgi:hypothetical protein